jgi:DNA polymerase III subunit beta
MIAFWPTAPLLDALAHCIPTICGDATRPHINSLCLHEVMASTDGHRLHTASLPTQLSEPLLIPLRSAQILPRILKGADNVVIARSDDTLKLRAGVFTLETKMTDAEFPPIDQVIPKGHETRLVVDASGFSKAIKKAGSLSSDRLKGIRMTINGVVELSSSEEDCESKVMVTPLENNHPEDSPDIIMGVNMAYMVDALARDKGQVTIEVGKPLDPILVRHEDDRLSVVMPMRV